MKKLIGLYGLFIAFALTSWVINLVKLLSCDFTEPWRDEVIHLIGLFPPCALVTAWL